MTISETGPQDKTLTPKQEAFARHYAAGGNGAAAARAAGYSAGCARQQAHEILQNPAVQARIEALAAAFAETARREAAILLERLDDAFQFASHKGDYRAMLDIARLQARLGGLMPDKAGQRAGEARAPATAAVLYDEAGGPGPIERARRGWPAMGEPELDAEALERAHAGPVPGGLPDEMPEEVPGWMPEMDDLPGPDGLAKLADLPGIDGDALAAALAAAGTDGTGAAHAPHAPPRRETPEPDIPLHIRTPRPGVESVAA